MKAEPLKPEPVSPIFLYLKSCRLGTWELKKLRAAGYVPIAVESFDAVKIMEPVTIGIQSVIAKSAYTVIANSTYDYCKKDFGNLVASALAKSNP